MMRSLRDIMENPLSKRISGAIICMYTLKEFEKKILSPSYGAGDSRESIESAVSRIYYITAAAAATAYC